MVHQHFLLAEALTVAENVALGRRRSAWGMTFNRAQVSDELRALSNETGLPIDPNARIEDLHVGERQRVEILKALSRGARILLLDEPTAVLAPPEVKTLFDTLERLRAAGRTIVIITHKLDEVFALAKTATVLRRGKTVFAGALEGLTPRDLARHMVGEAREVTADAAEPRGGVLLDASLKAEPNLDATFSIAAGEILGIAGVEGNGQEELAGALSGIRPARAGSRAALEGRDLLALSIRERAHAGLSVIPADRHRDGLVLDFTLTENLRLRSAAAANSFWFDPAKHDDAAGRTLAEYGVAPPDPKLHAGALSGGNQQKVILARELEGQPRCILACHPTRGLDVNAASAVHARLLSAARERGACVLLISADLDEVLRLSDRVGVLYKGRLMMMGARGVDRDAVGRAMAGVA